MWVIDLENAPPRLRGRLSRWGIEVRAGLYVGSAGAKMCESIWELVVSECDPETSAAMVTDSARSQGFELRTHGPNRREVVDLDGMLLVSFMPKVADAVEPPVGVLPPGAMEFSQMDIEEGYLEA